MTQQTILEGSTFCICDELGDVREKTHGLFADDTRFLSRLELTIDGKPPLLLSSGNVEYFSAAYFLRNPLTDRLPLDSRADQARAVRRQGDAGSHRSDERDNGDARAAARPRRRGGLRRHHLGEGVGLLAWRPQCMRSRFRSAVSVAGRRADKSTPLVDPDGYGRTQVIFSERGDVERCRESATTSRSRRARPGRCASTSGSAPTGALERAPARGRAAFRRGACAGRRVGRRVAAARPADPRLVERACSRRSANR